MAGVRSYSFREGDRSEYLAQFLLSATGLCTSIPRQEDIGFDFACSIADKESGILTFGYPYLISVKSLSGPTISVAPTKTAIEANDHSHVAWLFRQEQPTFLGVVDKTTITLRVFSLLPLWFLYYRGGQDVGSLSINPRLGEEQGGDVGPPKRGAALDNWPGHFHYDVDVGHPIAILDLKTIQSEERTRSVKKFLRYAVELAERTLLQYRLQIPYWYWFPKTTPNASKFQSGFSCQPVPPSDEARRLIMAELAPSLTSFALHFKETGDAASFQACKTLLDHAPPHTIPEAILQQLPELRQPAVGGVADGG